MSTWTRVYYNNLLSVPMGIASLAAGKFEFLQTEWSLAAIVALLSSCVVGIAISFAGFNLRKVISATSFTVVGVVCKLITVLINDVMWKEHSGAVEHVGLLICI